MFQKNNQNNIAWNLLMQNQNYQWQQLQIQVQSAALISPCVSQSGFYRCPANYDFQFIRNLRDLTFQGEEVSMTSENLDAFVSEFIDLFERGKKQKKLFKITFVNKSIKKQVNDFIKSRGSLIKYKMNEYINLLDYNIQLIHSISKDELPANDAISIELMYGFMIAYYGREILLQCPQLAILLVTTALMNGLDEVKSKDFKVKEPKTRKLEQLLKVISQKENIPFAKRMIKKKFSDIFELKDYFWKKFEQVKNNEDYSKKSRNRLRKLISIIDKHQTLKQEKYEVRKEIQTLHLHYNEDYRLQNNWECIFYQGIKQALNRMPTSIDVFNNATLRNPKLHLVYHFLIEKSQELQDFLDIDSTEQQKQQKQLAYLVQRTRKIGYFKSDWQNKLARAWSESRQSILSSIKQLQEQQLEQQLNELNKIKIQNQNKIFKPQIKSQSNTLNQQNSLCKVRGSSQYGDQMKEKTNQNNIIEEVLIIVPPPLQFSLAYDLIPSAHPFSFTYGRSGGYCMKPEESLNWFINDCNRSEKNYFYTILTHPEIHEKFDFLLEIPPSVRIFKPKKQMEDKFVNTLNKWLIRNKDNEELETIKVINEYINKKYEQLPDYLKKRIEGIQICSISIMSLFDTLFNIHYPEDVYLEETPLSTPFKYETLQMNSSAQKQNPTDINDYWGPPFYGGSVIEQVS